MSKPTRSVAVMVLIETDDKRLWPEHLDVSTPGKVAALRRALVAAMPQLSRVVLVTGEDTARLMVEAHKAAAAASGIEVVRPPEGYVPPTRG